MENRLRVGNKGTCLDHVRRTAHGSDAYQCGFQSAYPGTLCFALRYWLWNLPASCLILFKMAALSPGFYLRNLHPVPKEGESPTMPLYLSYGSKASHLLLLSRPWGQGWVTWPSPPEEAAAVSFPPRVKDGPREGRSRWFQFGSLQK